MAYAAPLPLAQFNEHLDTLIGHMPVTFVWTGGANATGKTYTGARTSTDRSGTLILGGEELKLEFDLFVKADEFAGDPALPVKGAIFQITGIAPTMRVIDSKASPDNGQLLTFSLAFARQ